MSIPRWSPQKSLWLSAHVALFLALAPAHSSLSALLVFVLLSGVSLCAGHSVGMHRGLIHRSYRAKPWLRRALAWLGCLVGLGGPLSLIALHDVRDHHQNLPDCDDYYAHRRGFLRDGWEQLHCVLPHCVLPHCVLPHCVLPHCVLPHRVLPHCAQPHPEGFVPRRDAEWEADPVLVWLERWWRWQGVPVAALLFVLGGWSWVVWGVFARVAVSIHGHWLVGWWVHNRGQQPRLVPGAGVQGYNSLLFGALSFGEGWHNNHHAYPSSAQMGLAPHELDLGWQLVRLFERLGWVEDVLRPEDLDRVLEPGPDAAAQVADARRSA